MLSNTSKGESRGGSKVKADFGGVSREIDISLVDAKVGDYVMVHAGFAIEIMDEHEAKETLELWKEMLEKYGYEFPRGSIEYGKTNSQG